MDPKIIKKWRDKLADLLDRARTVAQTGNLDARLALADELQAFIVDNPPALPDQPETAEFDEMDRIARRAHDGLLLDAINDRIAAIMSQTAELAALAKKIQGQTAANLAAAKTIQLEKTRKVVSTVNDTVSAIQDLQTQLDSLPGRADDLVELGKKLAKALQTLQDLRAAVEATG